MANLAELIFGKIRFFISIKKTNFAEIVIEDSIITIEILSMPLLFAAIIVHIMNKKRIASHKLRLLRESGFGVIVKYKGFMYRF
ncbi:MAG: hypothetical protein ISS36_04405 [Candidatus Aenigmarchaeota archaeon]|nr:hypothetical protein [Candidatus Aenigmarchaeota archaeon]